MLNAKGRRSAPGGDVSEGLIAFLDYVNGKGAGDEFTRRLDMAVANVINSDDFRVEYMSAVARYMEDEEEKEELRADIEKKQERIDSLETENESKQERIDSLEEENKTKQGKIDSLETENESLKAVIASLRNKQENG